MTPIISSGFRPGIVVYSITAVIFLLSLSPGVQADAILVSSVLHDFVGAEVSTANQPPLSLYGDDQTVFGGPAPSLRYNNSARGSSLDGSSYAVHSNVSGIVDILPSPSLFNSIAFETAASAATTQQGNVATGLNSEVSYVAEFTLGQPENYELTLGFNISGNSPAGTGARFTLYDSSRGKSLNGFASEPSENGTEISIGRLLPGDFRVTIASTVSLGLDGTGELNGGAVVGGTFELGGTPVLPGEEFGRFTTVPEPASAVMLACGVCVLAGRRWLRRQRQVHGSPLPSTLS
jgi:hypothetical protein